MRKIAFVGVLTLAATAGLQFVKACAPDFLRAVFSYVRHPDLPRSEFIDGRLGVLQPTFARSYLVIAYRYLNGIGLNPGEREQARDFYKDRETGSWDRLGTDWPKRWRAARLRIQSPPAPKTSLITGGQLAYDPATRAFALNCAEDAFRIALHTLEDRRRRFGSTSPAFRSWLGAQDMVFRNCDGAAKEIPELPPAGAPPLIRADREYQIAAANFYAGRYQEALARFGRIGLDTSSPWSAISRYLSVRTLLRMTDVPASAVQAGAQLQTEAQKILDNAKLAQVHGMTWNLMARAGIRDGDQVYFRALARLLSAKNQDNGLREELWNYTGMYDHVIGDADPNEAQSPVHPPSADGARFRDADLTDWIFSFQSRDAVVFDHCLARWKQTRSPAWLLAALSHAGGEAAQRAGLVEAAAAVPVDSPAYLTARFHLLRFLLDTGEQAVARHELDDLLSSGALKNLPSSINLFRGLRMLAAPTFEDFLGFVARRPVMVTFQTNVGEVPDFFGVEPNMHPGNVLLDSDATLVLNRETPFRLLRQAALNESLPTNLRREALLTAFVRGLMLDADLSDLAVQLGNTEPKLASFTVAYLKEANADGRRFAAAFLLLHRPESRPYFGSGITRQSRPGGLDSYRDNWWCPMDIEAELDSRAADDWYRRTPNLSQKSAAAVTPAFLGETTVEAKQELDKLGALGTATDFLGGIVFSYAKSRPEDSRVPEALYWLVRSGHYGCVDVNTWKTTRTAFRLLQRRYAKTKWAQRTPTWVKNDFDIRRRF